MYGWKVINGGINTFIISQEGWKWSILGMYGMWNEAKKFWDLGTMASNVGLNFFEKN